MGITYLSLHLSGQLKGNNSSYKEIHKTTAVQDKERKVWLSLSTTHTQTHSVGMSGGQRQPNFSLYEQNFLLIKEWREEGKRED